MTRPNPPITRHYSRAFSLTAHNVRVGRRVSTPVRATVTLQRSGPGEPTITYGSVRVQWRQSRHSVVLTDGVGRLRALVNRAARGLTWVEMPGLGRKRRLTLDWAQGQVRRIASQVAPMRTAADADAASDMLAAYMRQCVRGEVGRAASIAAAALAYPDSTPGARRVAWARAVVVVRAEHDEQIRQSHDGGRRVLPVRAVRSLPPNAARYESTIYEPLAELRRRGVTWQSDATSRLRC